jgi:hypothetical protein
MKNTLKNLALVVFVGAMSCGGGTSSSTGSTTSSSTTFDCCLNGQYYSCPSHSALDKCGDLNAPDPSECTRDSSKDSSCS